MKSHMIAAAALTCAARLSAHKVPRIVKLIEQLPVDERGKIKRAALATL